MTSLLTACGDTENVITLDDFRCSPCWLKTTAAHAPQYCCGRTIHTTALVFLICSPFFFFIACSAVRVFHVLGYWAAFSCVLFICCRQFAVRLLCVVAIGRFATTERKTRHAAAPLTLTNVAVLRSPSLHPPLLRLCRTPWILFTVSLSFTARCTGRQTLLLHLASWIFLLLVFVCTSYSVGCSLHDVTFWFRLRVESLIFFFACFLVSIPRWFPSTHTSIFKCYAQLYLSL